jgi:hypothetical protein
LEAITPHLKFVHCCQSLPTKSSRSFLPSPLPGTKGSIDVVEPSNTTLHFEILGVMFAKLLSCQLLQAISILWLPRITKRINMHINFAPTREHINISIGFCTINIATSEVHVVFKKK